MRKIWGLAAGVMLLAACNNQSSFDGFIVDGTTAKVLVELNKGKFTDTRDGQAYSVVWIGDRLWMAENLRYADSSKTKNLKGNVWCPGNSKDSCDKYGPLYSWTAAMNIEAKYASSQVSYLKEARGICPENWRIPTSEDWNDLQRALELISGSDPIAPGLKAIDAWEQEDLATKALNRFGFYALPAGRRNSEDGSFMSTGKYAFFWSGDQADAATSYGWTLRYDHDYLQNGEYYKDHGFSVRCVLFRAYDKTVIEGDLDSSFLDAIPFDYGKLEIGGKSYKTVKIGSQNWMAENVAYRTENSWCYNDEEANCDKFGRLYSFEDAMTVCPEGWRLPTSADFETLSSYVIYGGALRSRDGWTDMGSRGLNLWGFSALPAGGRETGDYFDRSISSYMWSSEGSVFWLRYYDDAMSIESREVTKNAFSVRCIEE